MLAAWIPKVGIIVERDHVPVPIIAINLGGISAKKNWAKRQRNRLMVQERRNR